MSKADFIGVALQRAGVENLKTPRLAPDYFPPVQSEDVAPDRQVLEGDETAGNRFPTALEYGGQVFGGSVAFFPRPNSLPVFLAMVFGEPETTPVAGESGVFDHVFDPAASGKTPMAATLWSVKADPTPRIVDQIVGAKGGEFSLEAAANAYLTATLGMTAPRLVLDAEEPSASRDLTRRWSSSQISSEISVNGQALAPIAITQFGLSYNNNLVSDQYVIGSDEVDDVPVGNVEPQITFTPTRDLKAHQRRALAKNPDDVRVRLLCSGRTIGTAAREEFEVDIKRAQYTEAPASINAGETLRTIEVTARPCLDDSTSQMIALRVRNTEDGSKYRAPTA